MSGVDAFVFIFIYFSIFENKVVVVDVLLIFVYKYITLDKFKDLLVYKTKKIRLLFYVFIFLYFSNFENIDFVLDVLLNLVYKYICLSNFEDLLVLFEICSAYQRFAILV